MLHFNSAMKNAFGIQNCTLVLSTKLLDLESIRKSVDYNWMVSKKKVLKYVTILHSVSVVIYQVVDSLLCYQGVICAFY